MSPYMSFCCVKQAHELYVSPCIYYICTHYLPTWSDHIFDRCINQTFGNLRHLDGTGQYRGQLLKFFKPWLHDGIINVTQCSCFTSSQIKSVHSDKNSQMKLAS